MLDALRPGESIAWDYLWQATLFLAAGLAASLLMPRRPARAHRLLLLAALAAMSAPPLTRAARLGGWGWLEHPRTSATAPMPPPGPISDVREAVPDLPAPTMSPAVEAPRVAERIASPPAGRSPVSSETAALGAWLALSGLAAARLLASFVRGLCMVTQARPIVEEDLAAAAVSAAARLGLRLRPVLRRSDQVGGPVIWCWGQRPVILLPATARREDTSIDWVGVFCHELAHRVRHDHWSGLAGELLVVVLPWHPLAWAARQRLGQLGELACDDWALAAGVAADDYAESLLGLVPQRGPSLAPSAVSSRRGLVGRIRYILDDRRIAPAVGRAWGVASAAVVAVAVSAVALAQARPSAASDERSATISRTDLNKSSDNAETPRHAAHGRVLGPDGRPVAVVEVLWLGHPVTGTPRGAAIRDDGAQRVRPPSTLSRSRTDADGRYTIAASLRASDYNSQYLLVSSRGFGLQSHYFQNAAERPDDAKAIDAEVTFHLVPEAVIHGRLLTPAGTPAAGARVSLDWFQYNDHAREGLSAGRMAADEELPPFWPKARSTDADGRFTLEGVPEGASALLTFQHPDCAVEDLVVNTARDGSTDPRLSDFEPSPAAATFTHTLGPPRPVQGRITDRATGRALAGILIEMTPMGRQGGRPFTTRTDRDGRYRISGHEGQSYNTTVYPSPSSGYLPATDRQRGWPAGAKILQKDFALERGRIVRGRVVDSSTSQPVAGAAVIYQPRMDNPARGLGATDVPNPVLTGADGRFAVTTLPGAGTILVEAPGGYVRTRFPQGKYERRALHPNGLADVDVPERGESAAIEIALRKGVQYEARVVDPDGRPVAPFSAYGPDLGGSATSRGGAVDYPGDRFIFPGADPDRAVRVTLVSARHRLAATIEVRPDASHTTVAEIRLQPGARVRGKIVHPDGGPASGANAYPMLVLASGDPTHLDRNQVLSQEIYSNLLESPGREDYRKKETAGADGTFDLDALVPGQPFYIAASSGHREAFRYVAPLKPGEVRDLGTIALEEYKP